MPSLDVEQCYNDVMKAICIILHIENEIQIYNKYLVKYLIHNFSFLNIIEKLNLKKYVKGNHENYFLDENDNKYNLFIDIGIRIKYYSNYYGKIDKYEFCDIFNINHSDNDIKEYIMNNTKNLLEWYHKHIFPNNTIIMLFNKKDIDEEFNCNIYVFDDFIFNYEIEMNKLKYTRKLNEWNISNTIKYNDITIGNFTIDQYVKFTYDLNKYISVLNRLKV
jgi:hypothetical protein